VSETALRPSWGSAHCGCGCRPSDAHQSGCGCKECQPGPGIDHLGNRHRFTTGRKIRMNALLAKEYDDLTMLEQSELDDLIQIYLHRPA
jgi:hypothetical protein